MDRLIVDYLSDLLDAMEKAVVFTSGMDYDVFREDDKTLFAVVRVCHEITCAFRRSDFGQV